MIPKARKNLHECSYHLTNMKSSNNSEEFEINFAAFVNSARNVTFVLQKEFTKDSDFNNWYTQKQTEMKNDELCKFFLELRNNIIKEGINGIVGFSFTNQPFNTTNDLEQKPKNAKNITIDGKGFFWNINVGTKYEDKIPAKHNGKLTTIIKLNNQPKQHLGKDISKKNTVEISESYFDYLKKLVDDFVELKIKRLS